MATDDNQLEALAAIHPLLPAKIAMDEAQRVRDGDTYKLFYEKTYASGNQDSYESTIKALTPAEAIDYAHQKLILQDALATWSTNITDAYLVSSDGTKLLIPDFSKK